MLLESAYRTIFNLRLIAKCSPVIPGLVRYINSHRMKFTSANSMWQSGLKQEILFWKFKYSSDFFYMKERLKFDRQIPSHLGEFIDKNSMSSVKLLDVGCGPMILGNKWKDTKIELTAVDPLADFYNKIIKEAKSPDYFHIENACVEELVSKFGRDCFDIVHASNSLDHCRSPMDGLRQMLAVSRPGGVVACVHFRNEGHSNAYHGLHQWNIDLIDGKPLIWSPRTRHWPLNELNEPVHFDGHIHKDNVYWKFSRLTSGLTETKES